MKRRKEGWNKGEEGRRERGREEEREGLRGGGAGVERERRKAEGVGRERTKWEESQVSTGTCKRPPTHTYPLTQTHTQIPLSD